MKLKEIQNEALRINDLYSQLEKEKFGRKWDYQDIFTGLVSDVGDLSRLVLAKDGMMKIEDLEKAIGHELSDCLWAILVLADKYDVELEETFLKNMKGLEERIKVDFE